MKKTHSSHRALWISIGIHAILIVSALFYFLESQPKTQEFGALVLEFTEYPTPQKQAKQTAASKTSQSLPQESDDPPSEQLLTQKEPASSSIETPEIPDTNQRISSVFEKLKTKKTNSERIDNNSQGVSPKVLDLLKQSDSPEITNNRKKSMDFARSSGGGKTGFFIGSREPVSPVKPPYKCIGNAVVVVEIIVDKYGKTLFATAGVEGSNYPSECFRKEAYQAAISTQWTPDPSSQDHDKGYIVYHFNTK